MRYLHCAEDSGFAKSYIVLWIEGTRDDREPCVGCLDTLVVGLVSGWPLDTFLGRVCDLWDVDGSDSTRLFEERLGVG